MSYRGWVVFLLAVLCTLATGALFATPPDNRPPDNRPPGRSGPVAGDAIATSTSGSVSESTSQSASESVSEATASNQLDNTVNVQQSLISIDGSGGAGVDAQASATSADGTGSILSPSQSVTFTAPKQHKNTPTTIAPDVYPTVSCFKGFSGALGLSGFGLSGGGGKLDPGCVEREEIRLAHAMGLGNRALWRWCGLENNVREFGSREECMAFGQVETTAEAAYHINEYEAATLARAEVYSEVEPLRAEVVKTSEAVERIERRLDANAAAAARAAREREQWKQELASKYLKEN